jgi:colicin import membrane protein
MRRIIIVGAERMPAPLNQNKCLLFSILLHFGILLVLVVSMNQRAMLPVFENTNRQDVISAVALRESEVLPSKPNPPPKPQPLPKVQSQPVKIEPKQEKSPDITKAIALKKIDKKKQAEKKIIESIKKANIFGKDLLSDIKTQANQQKKIAQKKIQENFKKTLREQSEKFLHEQVFNEIKLQADRLGQSQGEVNKYKALILQAISQHWIVPPQTKKQLFCELMIRTAPGGLVLDVQVIKTSGDLALDRSARSAVLKASPLPVPSKKNEFEAFRQFILKVRPEIILEHSG